MAHGGGIDVVGGSSDKPWQEIPMRGEFGGNLTAQQVSRPKCGILRGRSRNPPSGGKKIPNSGIQGKRKDVYPRYFLPGKSTAFNSGYKCGRDSGDWLRVRLEGFFATICSTCCWLVEGEI